MRIFWIKEALKDLKDIYEHRVATNEKSAMSLYEEFMIRVSSLALLPFQGRVDPLLNGLDLEYRSLVVTKNYKVVYRVDAEIDAIYIIAIYDCRRDPVVLREQVIRQE